MRPCQKEVHYLIQIGYVDVTMFQNQPRLSIPDTDNFFSHGYHTERTDKHREGTAVVRQHAKSVSLPATICCAASSFTVDAVCAYFVKILNVCLLVLNCDVQLSRHRQEI